MEAVLKLWSVLRRIGNPEIPGRSIRLLPAVLFFWGGSLCGNSSLPGESWDGLTANASDQRAAFREAGDFQARLDLVPELTLAHLAEGTLGRLPALFEQGSDPQEPWRRHAFVAEMHAVLGDSRGEYAARKEQWREGPDEEPLLDRLWDLAIELNDEDGMLEFSRRLAEVSGDRVHWTDHWRFLLRLDRDEEFVSELRAHGETLFSVRALFPELSSLNKLDLLVDLVRASEDVDDDPWRAQFALGEYWLFRGNVERAGGYFRQLVETLSRDSGSGGVPRGFQRLNQALFNRYAALRNRALGLGTYGSEAHVAYAFFGMREHFEIESRSQARDAAILYWKYDALDRGEAETFLRELEESLAPESISHGERVLAMAIAGAPELMMTAIARYLESGSPEAGTDRFVLRAVNRYVPSLDAFPHLRAPMVDVVDRIHGRLYNDGESAESDDDGFQQLSHLLHRLGERERVRRMIRSRMETLSEATGVPGLWERLNLAFNLQDLTAAEDVFEELIATQEGRDSFGPGQKAALRIDLAVWRWRETADAESTVRHLEAYFEWLAESVAETDAIGGVAFRVLDRWRSDAFPHENPYFTDADLEGVYQSVGYFLSEETFPLLREALGNVAAERDFQRLGALRFVEVCLYWWHGNPMGARLRLADAVRETGDPHLRFLAAFLFARDLRREQAENLLAGLDLDPRTEFQVTGLRFLLARGLDDDAGMAQAANALSVLEEDDSEKVAWAALLGDQGYVSESISLLRTVKSEALGPEGRDRRLQALFLAARETDLALPLTEKARFVLLSAPPASLSQTVSPLRREALKVLEETEELKHYRDYIRSARKALPGAFRLKLLEAESYEVEDTAGARERRKALIDEAAALRALDFETQLEYARWLNGNGHPRQATDVVDGWLQTHVSELLIGFNELLDLYDGADRLDRLVREFVKWEVPEARSMDEFYGIQPTNHIMEAIGRRLREKGNLDAAREAWRAGIRLNPVTFTESMRIQLAKLTWEQGRYEEYCDLMEDYLFRDRPAFEYGMWFAQPFASVVPRWLGAGYRDEDGELKAPLLEMLAPLLAEPDGAGQLVEKAGRWRNADPEDPSRRLFEMVGGMLADEVEFQKKWQSLKESSLPEPVLDKIKEWLPALRDDPESRTGLY